MFYSLRLASLTLTFKWFHPQTRPYFFFNRQALYFPSTWKNGYAEHRSLKPNSIQIQFKRTRDLLIFFLLCVFHCDVSPLQNYISKIIIRLTAQSSQDVQNYSSVLWQPDSVPTIQLYYSHDTIMVISCII